MLLRESLLEIFDENPNAKTNSNELICSYLSKYVCKNFIESFFVRLVLKRCGINLYSLEPMKSRVLKK